MKKLKNKFLKGRKQEWKKAELIKRLAWKAGVFGMLLLAGCSGDSEGQAASGRTGNLNEESVGEADSNLTQEADSSFRQEETEGGGQAGKGIARESAKDTAVDFEALKAENPDIFAWLYLPDTDIDHPVLQSEEADDYYESHDAFGAVNKTGALYTELANLKNMCDFNTVIHGKVQEGNAFADLYRFTDPDFFEDHEKLYLYLDGNLLTYEIFAAYERENTSLIRTYDFTYIAGCEQFLNDMYSARKMGKNLREGWEEVTPYHFLLTLTAESPSDSEKQLVVLAALIGDAAGTIDRVVAE